MSEDYKTIFDPYNDNLERGDTLPSSTLNKEFGDDLVQNPGNVGENVLDGKTIGNLTVTSWMKSQDYKPRSQGFYIDGRLGYIECMRLFVGSGGIIGGSLDIPNLTDAASFHVDSAGNAWWGSNKASGYTTANASILNTGKASFTDVKINGRDGTALATAIDSNANLVTDIINTKFDTDTKKILSDFTFAGLGAIRMNTDSNNGIWISPTGILGKKAGNTTFSITTSGDATFGGTLVAVSGTFGNITAGVLTGVSINGSTITGATIQTSASGNRIILNTNNLTGYDNPTIKRMQLDRNYLEFYNTSAQRTTTFNSEGFTIWAPGSLTEKRLNVWTDGSFSYIDAGYSSYGLVIRSQKSGKPPIAMFYYDGLYSQLLMQGNAQLIRSKYFAADSSGYLNFDSTVGASGYGFRMSGGHLEYNDVGSGGWYQLNLMGGSGVTAVYTSGAITGGPITSTGTISHSTSNGYRHLPSNGNTYQMLRASGSGTGAWTSTVYVGASSSTYLYASGGRIRTSSDFVASGSLHATGNVYTGGLNSHNGSVNCAYLGGAAGGITLSISGSLRCSTHWDPSSSGTKNLGGSSRYWNYLNVYGITKQGGGGWGFFDEGIEMQDGQILSDSEALLKLKPHPTKKTKYGKPIIDLDSLPKPLRVGKGGEDVFATISLLIGVAREYANRLNKLEKIYGVTN